MKDVTKILQSIDDGQDHAAAELLAIVYDELHRIAERNMARESPGHTLQTTALVHEAYLRLIPPSATVADESVDGGEEVPGETGDGASPGWQSRGHFFAAAAEAMRRILVDNARRKKRLKRGGNLARVGLDQIELVEREGAVDLIELDEALGRLEAHDSKKADIVKLRYFAGLTLEETAAALGLSVPTVHRHWRFARAWLRRELDSDEAL